MPRHEAVQKKNSRLDNKKNILHSLYDSGGFCKLQPQKSSKVVQDLFCQARKLFLQKFDIFKWFGAQFFFEFSLTQKIKIFTSFVDHSCICFLTLDWKVAKSKKVFIFIFPPNLKKTCTKSLYIQLFQLCKYF